MRGSLQTQKLLPALVTLVALMVGDTLENPTNLVLNGDFEFQLFDLETELYDSKDITTDRMDYIPFFRVVHKGVQILKSSTYHQPGVVNGIKGQLVCHLNTHQGPGVIHTTPIIKPRRGAPHTLQFLIADNPNGGEIVKAVKVSILVNNQVSYPTMQPFKVSSPYSSQITLDWRVKNTTFVGTGEPTKLQFESLMPGNFGPIIDNISVTIQTLVENGSFENANITQDETTIIQEDLTGVIIISAPSQAIPGWSVKSGKIKWISNLQFRSSTDRSQMFLDLNAEATTGTIASNTFTTRPGKKYTILFDTTANAAIIPTLKGYMLVSAFSYPRGQLLASRSVFVTSEGYHPLNLGWATYVLEFKAHNTESFIQFSSQIKGTFGGPLLDNVVVYEIRKPHSFKHVAPTWSAGKHLKPSIWTAGLTATVIMCVLGQIRSEMLFLCS